MVGRLLGIEGPRTSRCSPSSEDAQQAREVFFAAVRACVEGLARDGPLVLVWEDIHWADEGMLDLIEHLVQWVRAPVLQICLAREELLERRVGWGGVRRDSTTMFLEPLGESETRELISSLMRIDGVNESVVAAVAARAEGNPLFAEEMVRRLSEEEGASAAELPATVQALLAARLDSLEPFQRRLLAHAAVIGRTFWEGALVPIAEAEGGDLDEALRALRDKDIVVAGEGSALAGEPELAFKHALIRDAAYEMLPKAVRAQKHFEVARFIEARAGERVEEVVALLAEHYGRAAELGGELGLRARRPRALPRKGALLPGGGRRRGDRLLLKRGRLLETTRPRSSRPASDADAVARLLEKQGDVALRLGRVDAAIDVWERALDHHSGREDLEHVAELHRKIGAGLAHKGERKQAIEHHQRGINLIKDGDPSLALVRLYEEAAWLYMQTGDNMLAIYASEKALRLAERLGEVRAASRAHGIFGRVFGRIGDTVKARENLERAVELGARLRRARDGAGADGSRPSSRELRRRLHRPPPAPTARRSTLAREIGDVPAEIELHAAVGQLALYAADWEQAQQLERRQRRAVRARGPDRQALPSLRAARPPALARRRVAGVGELLQARARARRADRLVGGLLRRPLRAVEHAARPGRARRAPRPRSRPGARGLRARRPDRAIDPGERRTALLHTPRRPAREGRARPPRRRSSSPSASATPSARQPRSKPPASSAPCPEALADLERAREAWQDLAAPAGGRALRAPARAATARRATVEAALAALERAADEYDALGVAHLAARARELASTAAARS